MTEVGTGGVVVIEFQFSKRYSKDYKKLTKQLQERVDSKLDDLKKVPMPPGLRFEKLSGYSNPDLYTIHITGNYKVSFELIDGNVAWLRRVAPHDEIDRAP